MISMQRRAQLGHQGPLYDRHIHNAQLARPSKI